MDGKDETRTIKPILIHQQQGGLKSFKKNVIIGTNGFMGAFGAAPVGKSTPLMDEKLQLVQCHQ